MILWHNPRCSKSRQALALLQENGVEPEVRLYLQDAPSVDEIRAVWAALDDPLATMVRHKEAPYTKLGLADVSEDDLIAAMAENPILIERPILINGTRAAIGRPPEQVLDIL